MLTCVLLYVYKATQNTTSSIALKCTTSNRGNLHKFYKNSLTFGGCEIGGFFVRRKEVKMGEKQKQTVENLEDNMKNWNDEQRGFLLGFIEGVTQASKQEEEKKGE